MKVSDLMISDWVFNKHHKENIRLTPYDFFTHSHAEGGEQELLPNSKPAMGSDWSPIQVTKEILEKNGFYYDKTYKFAKITIANYYVLVWFDYDAKNIDYVQIKEQYDNKEVATSKLTNLYFTHIQYVHELQHAMQMVGLNDVIKTL